MSIVLVKSCPVCGNEELSDVCHITDHSVTHESFMLVQCNNCGLRITQGHPDENEIGRYYQSEEYISHTDTRSGLVNSLYHSVRRHMLGQKRRLVEKYRSHGRLLDIGAGTGYFAAHMQQAGWEVLGLEPDAGARSVALRQLQVELVPLENLHLLDENSFDVVTMWHVLEHVHDLNRQMSRIREILVDGGLLVVAVPNPASADARAYGPDWAAYDVPRHLWHFSPGSMKALLHKHGYELIKCLPMPFDAFYVSMLSEKYKGNTLAAPRGALQGIFTWFSALTSAEKASSLIYLAWNHK